MEVDEKDNYKKNKMLIQTNKTDFGYEDIVGKTLDEAIETIKQLDPFRDDVIDQYFVGNYEDVYDDTYDTSYERIYNISLATYCYESESEFNARRRKEKQEELEREIRLKKLDSDKELKEKESKRKEDVKVIHDKLNVLTTEEMLELYRIINDKLCSIGL
jgi:hypothetical protein